MEHKFVVIKDETSVYQECSRCKMVVYPEEHNIQLVNCLSEALAEALARAIAEDNE